MQQEGRLSEAPKLFAVLRVAATHDVVRPRLVARFAAAALERVVVVAASAGYGKSTALRQYLAASSEPFVRFDVRAEHGTLLGFARGFADAFSHLYPQLSQNLIDAYNGARAADAAGEELARWAADELRAFDGIVALDDLHLAQNDPQTIAFLTTLIESCERARWILCTRSTANLPIGTWAVDGAMTLPIDERDLCFTVEETHEAATLLDGIPDAEAVGDLVELTRGWPAALAFALRSSAHAGDARRLAAATRDVMYRYLSEQVYDSIALDDRELLQHIAYLPDIDFEVLSAAGFPNARKTLDGLRRRVTFIGVEHPERYKCHDLFIEFLRYRVETDGIDSARAIQLNVANALHRQDRVADAVRAYAAARSEIDVLRLLVAHGLDLNDTGYSDVISLAIAALSPETQASSAIVIALRGLHESQMGRFDKAEDLLRRALTKANEPSRAAAIGIRLAVVLTNISRDTRALLNDIEPSAHSTELRAEVLSLLAVAHAKVDAVGEATTHMKHVRDLVEGISDAAIAAKIWQRLGVSAMAIGMPYSDIVAYCTVAANLGLSSHRNALAATALGVLGNAALFCNEDLQTLREYARRIEEVAPADRLARRTAGIFNGGYAILRGDEEVARAALAALDTFKTSDPLRTNLARPIRAFVLVWQNQIEAAKNILTKALDDPGTFASQWDFGVYAAINALLCAANRANSDSRRFIDTALDYLHRESATRLHALRQIQRGHAFCGIAEALNGRVSVGERLLRAVDADDDATSALRRTGLELCSVRRGGEANVAQALDEVHAAGFGGYAKMLKAVFEASGVLANKVVNSALTKTEIAVLQALARGQSPKEIAAGTARSVHTIRTLAQHAAEKLGTSGRQHTIAAARRAGLISD